MAGHLCSYPVDFTEEDIALCDWVGEYTMTSPEKIVGLANAVRYISSRRIPGDIVECGVWRGGSAMVMGRVLAERNDTQRMMHLFDTFAGMTTPGPKDRRYDGTTADVLLDRDQDRAASGYWCIADQDDVRRNLGRCGYPGDRIRLVPGDVAATIPAEAPPAIALLRLDTDWYESTRHELEHLYHRVSTGGVVIIDDYGHWEGSRRAVDEFLTTLDQVPLLTRLDFDGRMWIKA
jgi:O-methyltransferase